MSNLDIYNALKQPPKEALRTIKGGRLQGFTDVNPQWRYKAMTEQFGACGVGWKYEIVDLWNEPAGDGQIFAFAMVNVFIKQGDAWSEPIPGCGGSMLVEKEKAGLHASDEGYKMSITDALGTAMKMLGVAADIYAGLWDGAKYRDAEESLKKDKPMNDTQDQNKPSESHPTASGGITEGQTKKHWCEEHNTAFFMGGKMKSFAHPISNTGKWCHEHKEKAAPEAEPDASTTPEEDFDKLGREKVGGELKPHEEEIEGINMDWVKESLQGKLKAWKVGLWLHEHFPLTKEARVRDIMAELTVEQRQEFGREVKMRLKKE